MFVLSKSREEKESLNGKRLSEGSGDITSVELWVHVHLFYCSLYLVHNHIFIKYFIKININKIKLTKYSELLTFRRMRQKKRPGKDKDE